MNQRSRKPSSKKSPWALAITAVLGLAALWLGVDPNQLRNHPEQALEQIAGVIAGNEQPGNAPMASNGAHWAPFLTAEARQTVVLIQRGGPYPHRQDGTTFGNREKRLPQRTRGWYREYTVATPGLNHRGARRIVTGGHPPSEWYYTADHYDSFSAFTPPAGRTQ